MFDPRRRHRRWAWAFWAAGHPYIYSTTAAWPTAGFEALWPDGSPTVSVLPALTHVGNLRERLPPLGGVAHQSSIEVTLTSRGDSYRPPGDPGDVFARLGVASASSWALVTGFELTPGDADTRTAALTADVEPPFRVLLNKAFVPPAGGGDFVVHVGPEAMLATAEGGSEDDVGGDPYYVQVTDRAIGGTTRRPHTARAAVLDYPVLVGPEPVFWRSRRAVLFAAERLAGGGLGEPFEVMRGFIEQTPGAAGDGLSFPVQLSPLSALLDQAVDRTTVETRLVRGLHWHEAGIADELLFVEELRSPWQATTRDVSAVAAGTIDLSFADTAAWSATFDPDADDADPRSGWIEVQERQRYAVSGTAAEAGVGDPDQLTLEAAGAPTELIAPQQGIHGPSIGRARRVRLDGGAGRLLRWPGAVDDGDHSAVGILNAAMGGADHTGADGAWTRLRVTPGINQPVRVERNVDRLTQVWAARMRDATVADLSVSWDPDAPADEFTRRLWLPFQWQVDGDNPADRVGGGRTRWIRLQDDRRYPMAPIPRAYYQRGEQWLLVEDDLDVSTGEIEVDGPGRFPIRVPVDTSTTELVVPAIGSALDGQSVYLIRLLDPDVLWSFAERLDDEVFRIGARRPAFERSGDLILHLLQDAGALGLGPDDIDEASITGHQGDPSWVQSWRVPAVREPQSFGELIGGICRLTRSTLVMRTDQLGRCRLTRVPIGAESAARVAATIGEGDWLTDRRPTWDTDDRIINVITVRADYGPDDEGEPEWRYAPDAYVSRTSQTLFQETEEDTLEAAAAGDINRRARRIDLTPRSLLALYDTPRRRWAGRVGTHQALLAHLGATVQLSSRHLRGYGTDPVVDALAVVYERTLELWDEGAELMLLHFGVQTSGWNFSMEVESVTDATTIVVKANKYSSPEHPVTGQPWLDIDAAAAGDILRCMPACNQGAAVDRTALVVDRDTRSITFDGAHGLIARDWIVPPSYASASSLARRYAYMGDVDGEVAGALALSYS